MLRYAIKSDLPAVAELYWSVWHETHAPLMPQGERDRRTRNFFMKRISAFAPCALVSEGDGEIVAFSAWQGNMVGQLFVLPEWRGRGIADALMVATETELVKSGVIDGELHCLVGNDRARRFWERLGWTHSGEIIEPAFDAAGETGVPFWRMIKTLSDGGAV